MGFSSNIICWNEANKTSYKINKYKQEVVDKKYDLHDLLQNLRDQQSNKINPMIISIMEQKFFGSPKWF